MLYISTTCIKIVSTDVENFKNIFKNVLETANGFKIKQLRHDHLALSHVFDTNDCMT